MTVIVLVTHTISIDVREVNYQTSNGSCVVMVMVMVMVMVTGVVIPRDFLSVTVT